MPFPSCPLQRYPVPGWFNPHRAGGSTPALPHWRASWLGCARPAPTPQRLATTILRWTTLYALRRYTGISWFCLRPTTGSVPPDPYPRFATTPDCHARCCTTLYVYHFRDVWTHTYHTYLFPFLLNGLLFTVGPLNTAWRNRLMFTFYALDVPAPTRVPLHCWFTFPQDCDVHTPHGLTPVVPHRPHRTPHTLHIHPTQDNCLVLLSTGMTGNRLDLVV